MKFASATRRMALALTAAALLAGPAMAQAPAAYDGVWAGALAAGGQTLHLELTIKTVGGETTGELNSLDQQTVIPATAVKMDGGQLSVLFLAIGGEYAAKLSADGKSLTGTFTQGATFPLTMTKK